MQMTGSRSKEAFRVKRNFSENTFDKKNFWKMKISRCIWQVIFKEVFQVLKQARKLQVAQTQLTSCKTDNMTKWQDEKMTIDKMTNASKKLFLDYFDKKYFWQI